MNEIFFAIMDGADDPQGWHTYDSGGKIKQIGPAEWFAVAPDSTTVQHFTTERAAQHHAKAVIR